MVYTSVAQEDEGAGAGPRSQDRSYSRYELSLDYFVYAL